MQFQEFNKIYLDRLQRGESVTEQHFAAYFGELIYLKLGSRIRSRDVIEDLRQETFVRFFTLLRKEGVRDASALGSLINSVCNRVVLEHYRLWAKEAAMEDVTVVNLPSENNDAFRELLSRDTQGLVRQILSKLDEHDSKLLKSIFLEERDRDEVCVEFGVDRNYLRVLVHRAKLSFKAKYVKQLSMKKAGPGSCPAQERVLLPQSLA